MANKMIFGVCARLANKFGVNVSVIRIVWVLAALLYGVGVGLYLVMALIFYILDKQ